MSSSHTISDGDAKAIAAGGVIVRKEFSYAEHKEVQWSVNETNGFPMTGTSRLLKFELRRPPKNEKIEDIVICWEEQNPSAADVTKLPTFFNCVDSVRVLLNNKEVVDMKNIHGIRTEWRDRIYTRYGEEQQQDYAWHWRTGTQTQHVGDLLTPIVIVAGGTSAVQYASMGDLLGGVFDGLCMSLISLIEIEMTLTGDQKLIGDVAEATQILHNNIKVYSRHKVMTLTPPRVFANHTLYHAEHEVLKYAAPSPLHVGGAGELVVDLHQFIPHRSNISRIHVFGQRGPSSSDAYRAMETLWLGSLRLERNGDPFLATEWFYRDRRQIAHQSQKYFRRHHGGVTTPVRYTTGINFGSNMSEMFVDCTAVTKTINPSPIAETKVKASEGIDNQSNINLVITCDGVFRLPLDSEAIIVVEWSRFDRINPSGQVIRIANP
jgi:hypothetical protein